MCPGKTKSTMLPGSNLQSSREKEPVSKQIKDITGWKAVYDNPQNSVRCFQWWNGHFLLQRSKKFSGSYLVGGGPWRIMMTWRWTVKDHMTRNGKKNPGKRNDRIEGWRKIRNMESWIGLVTPKGVDNNYRKKI